MKNENGFFEVTDIISSVITLITLLILVVKILGVIL